MRGALLLHFLHLIDQVVCLFQEIGALIGTIHGICLTAIEKVQIRHGVVVIRLNLNGLLEVFDAFIN